MKKSLLLLPLSLMTWSAFGQVFLPERGDYSYTIKEVNQQLEMSRQNYITYIPQKGIANAKYKLNEDRNEFQMKDWYLRDWYLLQDMYKLNFEGYLQKFGAPTFNIAKQKQYSQFLFDAKKFTHQKTFPAMKEWGGLTHPPIKVLDRPLEKYNHKFNKINYSQITSPYFDPKLQREVDDVSKSELTFNNVLETMEDNNAFVGKKWLINKAQHSILMSSLVFVCDKSTREIVDLLIKKHRERVNVKIIADGFVSKALAHRECLLKMKNAGIEVLESNQFFKHNLKAIYHTKTLVIDNEEAIAGGHNMIDADNLSRGTDFQNRDVDLYVRGPMVSDISKQFMENWNYLIKVQNNKKEKLSSMQKDYEDLLKIMAQERRDGHRGKKYYEEYLKNPSTRMKGVCRFIKQAPHEDGQTVGKAYLKLLGKLRNYLVITDPVKTDSFFEKVTDRPLEDRLDTYEVYNELHLMIRDMALSGKPIDYITTNIDMAGNENVAMMNDMIRSQLKAGKELAANWSYAKIVAANKYYGNPHYKNLLKDWVTLPHLNVWTHISFMHSKIFYFDRIVASIGSVNFQHNATDQAYESTSICMDEDLNHQLDKILVMDMANSIPLVYSALR